jgi:hypothetical protein
MASLDNTVTNISTGFNVGPQTFTWSHTIGGEDALLVLCADIWQDVGGVGTITAATFGLSLFTKIAQQSSNAMSAEMWYIKAPTLGTHIVSVTVTGATDAIKLATSSFFEVDQFAPLEAQNFATGSAGNPTCNVTSLTGSALIVSTLSRFSTTNATPNTFTNLYNDHAVSTLATGDYLIAGAAGAQTAAYTGTSSNDWVELVASFVSNTTSQGGKPGNYGRYFTVADGMSRSEVAN